VTGTAATPKAGSVSGEAPAASPVDKAVKEGNTGAAAGMAESAAARVGVKTEGGARAANTPGVAPTGTPGDAVGAASSDAAAGPPAGGAATPAASAWPDRILASRVNYGVSGKTLASLTALTGPTLGGTPAALRVWDVDASVLPLPTAEALLAARRHAKALSAAVMAAARVALMAHGVAVAASIAARAFAAAGGAVPARSPAPKTAALEKVRVALKRVEAAAEKEIKKWELRVAADAGKRSGTAMAASQTARSARFMSSFVRKAPPAAVAAKAARLPPSTATPAAKLIASGGFLSAGDIDRQLGRGAARVIDVDAPDGSAAKVGGTLPTSPATSADAGAGPSAAAALLAAADADASDASPEAAAAPPSPRLPPDTLRALLADARRRRRSAGAGAVRRMGVGSTAAGDRLCFIQFDKANRPPWFGVYPGRGGGRGGQGAGAPPARRVGRRPIGRRAGVDYEVDSDDEWEEEEPGESVSADEGEEEEAAAGSDWDSSDGEEFIAEDDPEEGEDDDDEGEPEGAADADAPPAADADGPPRLSPDDVMDVDAAAAADGVAVVVPPPAVGAKRKKGADAAAGGRDRKRRRRRRRAAAALLPARVVVAVGAFDAAGGWTPPADPAAAALLAATRFVASPYARVEGGAGAAVAVL